MTFALVLHAFVLASLKLSGFISLSWLWVLCPLWAPLVLWLLSILLFTVAAFR